MEVAVDDVRPKTKDEIVATAQALGMDLKTLFDESCSTEPLSELQFLDLRGYAGEIGV